MSEFRKQFLARLLLVAAQAAGPSQGPTNCTSSGVYMTLPIDPMGCREPRRRPLTSYIVDSGASLHCINDINLFDLIYQNHRPVRLRPLPHHASGSLHRSRWQLAGCGTDPGGVRPACAVFGDAGQPHCGRVCAHGAGRWLAGELAPGIFVVVTISLLPWH